MIYGEITPCDIPTQFARPYTALHVRGALSNTEEKHPELEYLVDKHHILNPDENSGGKVMESKVLDVGKVGRKLVIKWIPFG